MKSLDERNKESIEKMKARAINTILEYCDVLDEYNFCKVLNYSTEELEYQINVNNIVIYTDQSANRYFPVFQIQNGRLRESVGYLMREFNVSSQDKSSMNLLIHFLIMWLDYSNPGEAENIVEMHTLIDDRDTLAIVRREWNNRLKMGR